MESWERMSVKMKNKTLLPYLQYFDSFNLNESITKDKDELLLWHNTCEFLYNSINYERLIYFEKKYKDNLEIQEIIEKLKGKIAYIYENKQRLISKLSLDMDKINEQ